MTLFKKENIILIVTYKSVRLDLNPVAEVQPRKHYLARRGSRSDLLQGPEDGGSTRLHYGPLDKEVNMKLGFHGATTMTADLQTDGAASQKSGCSRVKGAVFF